MSEPLFSVQRAGRVELSHQLRLAWEWWQRHESREVEVRWRLWPEMAPALRACSPEFLAARLHPHWRAPLSQMCLGAALARLELEMFPSDALPERWFWEAALAFDGRGARAWEREFWGSCAGAESGFLHVRHRLADLCRCAGALDRRAVRHYIEVWGHRDAPPAPPGGRQEAKAPQELLRQALEIASGAALSDDELLFRQGGCLRLQTRAFGASWIVASLQEAALRTRNTPSP